MTQRSSFKSFYQVCPKDLFLAYSFKHIFKRLVVIFKEAELVNFADDSTLYVSTKRFEQSECEIATVTLLGNNGTIVNPDKVQLMIISSKKNLSC